MIEGMPTVSLPGEPVVSGPGSGSGCLDDSELLLLHWQWGWLFGG